MLIHRIPNRNAQIYMQQGRRGVMNQCEAAQAFPSGIHDCSTTYKTSCLGAGQWGERLEAARYTNAIIWGSVHNDTKDTRRLRHQGSWACAYQAYFAVCVLIFSLLIDFLCDGRLAGRNVNPSACILGLLDHRTFVQLCFAAARIGPNCKC